MILVDTSIWADHINRPDRRLQAYLDTGQVVIHPHIVGELALGNLRDREIVIGSLTNLPRAVVAFDREVLGFIERHELQGTGLGYVDAHLLASAVLSDATALWSRDRRLRIQAERLGVAHEPEAS